MSLRRAFTSLRMLSDGPQRRPDQPVFPAYPAARGGRQGPAEADGRQRPLHRRRGPGLARDPLSRGSGRGPDRDHRRRQCRGVQPPAPDHPHHGGYRTTQGAFGKGKRGGAEPGREGRASQHADQRRERDGTGGAVRRRDRRLRQLPYAVPGERRVLLPEEAVVLWFGAPVRRPGLGLPDVRGCAVLSMPL